MSIATGRRPARESLNIRIRPEDRRLIDRAASALERAIIAVSPEAYAEFVARLDAPVQLEAALGNE